MKQNKFDVVIIGGGLAGLTAALSLANTGKSCALIEKKNYPHHKVCGEYISNEILPFLQSLGINPFDFGACKINRFEISTHQGKLIESTLPLGGFGISRYTLDQAMYQKAKEQTYFYFETVTAINHKESHKQIETQEGTILQAKLVIGAFGKRSILDKFLNRTFSFKKSSWLAVKAHYKYDLDPNKVVLHNFEGGYCGLSKVEDNRVNACYLTTYDSFKKEKDILSFQKNTMAQNPHLNHFFNHATPLFEAPLTISQISFDKKQLIEQGIIMVGDSAGLIHPLCGNGMAMAIHSAKIVADLIKQWDFNKKSKPQLEEQYTKKWEQVFEKRLQTGRQVQKLLLQPTIATLGFKVAKTFPSLVPFIIKKTHGAVI